MEEEYKENQLHDLTLGNVCTIKNGKFAGKTVLIIKAGIQTKFGLKSITVEYFGEYQTGEKIWVSPEQLTYNGANDDDTANAIKEADYQEWKSRKNAGVPPSSSFSKKKQTFNKESDDVPF